MIMQLFMCVILFLCLYVQDSSSNYIQCTSKCSKITVSFLKPLDIPKECQNTRINDIYDNASVCIIDYRIDYDANSVYIEFKASNDTMAFQEYNQTEFLIQTIWLGFNEESGQPNITHRRYVCSTDDDCARLFYFNTIKRLISDGQLLLNKIKSRLYRQSLSLKRNTTRRCQDSNPTGNSSSVRCRDGLCYVNSIDAKQSCIFDNSPTFFSEFEHYLPESITNGIELVEFRCNRHLCNNNKTVDAIKDIIRNYTNWGINTTEASAIQEKSSSVSPQSISYHLIVFLLLILGFYCKT